MAEKKTYKSLILPKGILQFCWFTKVDNYKKYSCTVLIPKDEPLLKPILDEITKLTDEYYETTFASLKGKVPPKVLETYKKVYPFSEELDKAKDFAPTGNIMFKARSSNQPQVIDSKLQPVTKPVFGGSEGKVKITLNFYHDPAKVAIGCSAWLNAVQILSLAKGTGGALTGFSVEATDEPPSDGGAPSADF